MPESLQEGAYENRPYPIGEDQTISQPLMVALMTELLSLSGGERVLEIGTGSGYQTAILAELAGEVITIERHPNLAERARSLLEFLGYSNVRTVVGDGSGGLPDEAPFDRILVTAGSPAVPPPLLDQLIPGGRMVIPIGRTDYQRLESLYKKFDGQIESESCGDCVFVPLVGAFAWPN